MEQSDAAALWRAWRSWDRCARNRRAKSELGDSSNELQVCWFNRAVGRGLTFIIANAIYGVDTLSAMPDERETWIRHFFYLALFAAAFHSLQFLSSLILWRTTRSAALISYGLDAVVSAVAALVLAGRLRRE